MVHLNKTIQEGDNPDLTAERLTATFDTHAMAAQIYGGEMVSYLVKMEYLNNCL